MTSATGATSPEEARELHVAGIHLRRDGRVMRVMGLAQEGGSQRLRAVQGGARYSGVQRCPTVFRRRAHVRSGLQQPFSRAEVVVEAGGAVAPSRPCLERLPEIPSKRRARQRSAS